MQLFKKFGKWFSKAWNFLSLEGTNTISREAKFLGIIHENENILRDARFALKKYLKVKNKLIGVRKNTKKYKTIEKEILDAENAVKNILLDIDTFITCLETDEDLIGVAQ